MRRRRRRRRNGAADQQLFLSMACVLPYNWCASVEIQSLFSFVAFFPFSAATSLDGEEEKEGIVLYHPPCCHDAGSPSPGKPNQAMRGERPGALSEPEMPGGREGVDCEKIIPAPRRQGASRECVARTLLCGEEGRGEMSGRMALISLLISVIPSVEKRVEEGEKKRWDPEKRIMSLTFSFPTHQDQDVGENRWSFPLFVHGQEGKGRWMRTFHGPQPQQ